MRKEILFASRKGGTGKSTLCAMVANHLAGNGMKGAVIDCDNCATLSWWRKADMRSQPEDGQPPYPIFRDGDYFDKEHLFEEYDYVLIDNYDLVREDGTGIVVVPFTYTEMVLDSTFAFVRDMGKARGREVMFVPNEVQGYKQSVKNGPYPWTIACLGSSRHRIFLARILEWVAISYSRGCSQPWDQTRVSCVSCIGRQILYH